VNSVVTRTSGDPRSTARKPKTRAEALGQVFTPQPLAQKILENLGVLKSQVGVRLLDPCVGPATFPFALRVLGASHVSVHAYDIDPIMADATRTWATTHNVNITVDTADYLNSFCDNSYDFAVLNPPYVRQEWIEHKEYYRSVFRKHYGIEVPGTSNLYVYFIVKALADLKEGGRMACIVYDSWQTTRFGQWLQAHLYASCCFVNVESVPNLPFEGRLIDATIIIIEKGNGTNLLQVPKRNDDFSTQVPGVSPVSQLFSTKRGLRLKQADFFMTDLSGVENDGADPFVKKINLIPGFVVPKDHPEAALLLRPSHRDARTVAALKRRLAAAQLAPDSNVSVLTWWRERPQVWDQHGDAPWAPLIFNYYLRRRPRHIYNPERVYSDNFYGLTPNEVDVPIVAWLAALNTTLSVIGILECARNQGAGLAKLQLFEYREARVVNLNNWSQQDVFRMAEIGQALISNGDFDSLITSADKLVASVLDNQELHPDRLRHILNDVDCRARRPKD
jgi:adenine-specific DNA-methyltransferase